MKSVTALIIIAAVTVAIQTPALAGNLEQAPDPRSLFDSEQFIRVDDLTLVSRSTGDIVHLPTAAHRTGTVPPVGTGTPTAFLTMNDGYVACSTTNDCWAFDLDTYTQGAGFSVLPEGSYPYDATMNFDGSEVWIPGAVGDGVVVVDRATDTITHRISAGDYSISVVFTDNGERALVSNRTSRDITIIDTSTYGVIGTLDLGLSSGFGPGNMALDPDSGKIYAVRWYDGELFEISPDGSQLLDTRLIGDSLWQLVVSPDGQLAYVTDRGTDQVLVVELATLDVIDQYAVGDDPWGIDITADGQHLVVACEDASIAYVIDTGSSLVTPIPLPSGADPRDVDIRNQDGLAFMVGGRVGTTDAPVYVIDIASAAVSASFEVGGTNTNVVAVEPQMHSTGPGAVSQTGPAAPRTIALTSYPNPFNPSTMIDFSIPVAGRVRIGVYDGAGRLVSLLVDGHREAGRHRVGWNGRDRHGRTVSGGVFFVHLDAAGRRETTKIALVK